MTDDIDHKAIYTKLGGMDVKLDTLLANQVDQEVRLRGLEKHRNWFAGVLAAAGLGGSTAATFWDKINVFN